MKQFLEFIPLIIFFIVYKIVNIYAATAALMISMAIVLIFIYFTAGKIGKMQWITFAMVMVFGTLTIALHDDVFIKWKVTVVYGLFTIVLLVTQFIFNKPAIKQMLSKEFTLPEKVWNNLNLAWAIFFAVLGVLNLYIAFNMPINVWVNFKVFGLMGATLVFTVISVIYIYKYLPKTTKEKE